MLTRVITPWEVKCRKVFYKLLRLMRHSVSFDFFFAFSYGDRHEPGMGSAEETGLDDAELDIIRRIGFD